MLLVGGEGGSDSLGNIGFGGGFVDAEAGEHASAVLEFQQSEQDVLGADVIVAHPQGLPEGELQRLTCPRVERDEFGYLVGRGLLRSPSTRCSGRISSLPAARASFCAAITTFLAGTVNRPNPWLGSRSDVSPPFGTKRFCAACLLTPMLLPMSVQDAPERLAWSTKWPIRWSATSPR